MANKKISELAVANPLGVGDLFEVNQGGVNKKLNGSQLSTFVGGSAFVDGETPSGAIDDANDDFVLANTPIVGSVKVYLNGIRLQVTTDYTISGTTITFVTPPTAGPPADIILVDYRK